MATNEMAKGGGIKQSKPQETDSTYSKAIDKQVVGKPVGWRFTDKLAKKLGKKPGTKPTAAEIEKYKNRGVYFETRKNKSDLNPKAKLEGGGENEYAKGGQTAPQRESYSKRGDKEVKAKPVGYRFTEKLANRLGKNVYTKPTQEQVEKYRGRGVYFENRKDKSDINPRAMFEEGGDMEYARGGQTAPQRESYSKRGDKEVKAKPVGYRFTEKLANRLGKNVYTKPTQEQVEKYRGRGVYFENRKDKSDINPRAMFEEGGDMEYARGGNMKEFLTYDEINGLKIGKWKCDVLNIDIGGGPVVWENPSSLYFFYAEPGFNGERKLHFQVEMDETINLYEDIDSIVFKSSNPLASFNKRSYLSEIKKVIDIIERNKDGELTPSDFKKDFIGARYEKYAQGGDVEYAKGGQTAPQRESYSKRGDKEVTAKPVGYRFTNALAKRLGKKVTTKPNAEEIRKYLGKGVYFENRKDKSDIKPKEKLMGGGDTDYAKGGQTAPQETDSTYSKSIDKQVSGKPVGYRFTNKLANKLGKKQYTKPTAAEIEKYSGKGVYFETRKNKSDLNPKAKLEGGGESEYARGGGVPRTSNADSKAYTENHLPFMANNLEGKTLENGDYVVLSYGYYPIWFWHKRTNKWYGNKDKFSVTTAKHISQSRPTYEAEMLSRGEMDNLMSKSIEGKDFKEMGGTLDSFVVAQQ